MCRILLVLAILTICDNPEQSVQACARFGGSVVLERSIGSIVFGLSPGPPPQLPYSDGGKIRDPCEATLADELSQARICFVLPSFCSARLVTAPVLYVALQHKQSGPLINMFAAMAVTTGLFKDWRRAWEHVCCERAHSTACGGSQHVTASPVSQDDERSAVYARCLDISVWQFV